MDTVTFPMFKGAVERIALATGFGPVQTPNDLERLIALVVYLCRDNQPQKTTITTSTRPR